jgi:hypothetical protein
MGCPIRRAFLGQRFFPSFHEAHGVIKILAFQDLPAIPRRHPFYCRIAIPDVPVPPATAAASAAMCNCPFIWHK